MPAAIIDGKKIAKQLTDEVKAAIEKLKLKPGLAVIRVGENPASVVYVNKKATMCEELGFYSEKHELPAETSEEDLVALIERCNANKKLHGILVQLPLPSHIDTFTVQSAVDPEKDVDGFHPVNLGKLLMGAPSFVSATPRGIATLIASVHPNISGKHVVVVGRSAIVGKPVAQLMLLKDATVTMCHSKTQNLAGITRMADILIVAIGKPKAVTADMIKPGATVIDVGINRLPDGTLCGDVDFDQAKEIAGHITPVPGGVGPMTIASLMQNTYEGMRHSVK